MKYNTVDSTKQTLNYFIQSVDIYIIQLRNKLYEYNYLVIIANKLSMKKPQEFKKTICK